MLFVEFRFFIFFAFVFSVTWTLRSNTARKLFLLLCSHAFYACFFIGDPWIFFGAVAARHWQELPAGWWFPFVLMGSTCLDYVSGLAVEQASENRRRLWLSLSLAVNIGVLCWFKYFNFFIVSAAGFLAFLGLPGSLHTLRIILPYGVSFYTFQSMSYTIEVFRRHRPAERNFLDLAFFIAFFPQLVAGPIVRAMTFLPQTKTARVFSRDVDVRGALVQFMTGFVKKACLAETVAPFVDRYFADPKRFNAISAWIGVLLYAVQIYGDFSGYTDMAIATARLLGYELTVNFRFPYFARNVTDFWRRWHISLSTWLRDYLYISLGGNRGTRVFAYRNLMLTMLLGGLWHGASWVFVIWGALHGAALVAHREWRRWREARSVKERIEWIPGALATLCTFYFTCVCWIFFRARDLHQARLVCRSFIFLQSHGSRSLDPRLLWLFAGLAFIHWLNYRQVFTSWWRRAPAVVFAAGYGFAVSVILPFVPQHYTPFIYFQF